jgi:Zn-dependent protease with chaperone function
MKGQRTNSTAVAAARTARGGGAPVGSGVEDAQGAEASVGTQILCALKGRVEPVALSPLYALAMLPVAVLMLLLPVIYMALIVGVGYAVYWHAVNDLSVFRYVPSGYLSGVIYTAPIFAGVVLLFFMVKPFFTRRRIADRPFIVRREDEPLLYQFVDQLCETLGSKRPVHIEIDCQLNAAAGYKGVLSLITGRMFLVIGLPLVAGMEVQQFAGILAHELGHFSQRSSTRMVYIIRNINHWFTRVVFERDKWDMALLRASRRANLWSQAFAGLTRLLVWITRRILWCLLWIGTFFSALMMRRQEYDADTYEARLVGADVFEQTTRRLQSLIVAQQIALRDLGTNWRERRLADDLPMLICTREAELDDEVRRKITEAFSKAKTGRFSTHPCDRDRIAAARRLNPKPVFSLDIPAGHLFKDFKELCRMASIKFYQLNLGKALKAEHLYTTENLLGRSQARKENFTALQRYFQGLISPLRPLNIFGIELADRSVDGRAEIIMQARTKLCASIDEATADAKAFNEAAVILDKVVKVRALQTAGIKFDPAKFGMKSASAAELADLERQAILVRKQASEVLEEVLRPQARRIQAALAKDEAKGEGVEETYDLSAGGSGSATDGLMEALRAIVLCRGQAEVLRGHCRNFMALLSVVRPTGNSQMLVGEVISVSKAVSRELAGIHTQLRTAPYPYEHTERGASISRFCCSVIPPQNKYRALCNAAMATIGGIDTLYMRLMSDLAQRAEEAERGMGLEALGEPPQMG